MMPLGEKWRKKEEKSLHGPCQELIQRTEDFSSEITGPETARQVGEIAQTRGAELRVPEPGVAEGFYNSSVWRQEGGREGLAQCSARDLAVQERDGE